MARKSVVHARDNVFGEVICRYRQKMRLSQESLGLSIGIGKNAVGAWEKGRSRPDISSVPMLCQTLHISYEEFFGSCSDNCNEDEQESFQLFYRLKPSYQRAIICEIRALYDRQQKETQMVNPSHSEEQKYHQLFYNHVSAAAGISSSIDIADGEMMWIRSDAVSENADEIIRVNGDSMEPFFSDGDLVFVKHTK